MTGPVRRPGRTALVLLLAALLSALVAGPASAAPGARPPRVPLPAPIAIRTIPPVPGYPVIFDGVTVPADAAGQARFVAVNDGRPLSDRITLTDAELVLDGRKVKASGSSVSDVWNDPVIRLDLSYQVTFHFAAVNGAAIDESAIEGITLKSTNGEVVEMHVGETPWLHGTRAVQVLGETQVRKTDWSVQRVDYAGSNVVNAAQQGFRPADQPDVAVALLFFHVSFQVSDAFFGFPQRGGVHLVFPDGTARSYPVDSNGRLALPLLPRGDYTLTSSGSGPDLTRPLAISRDQEVDLSFYSWLDILLALGVLLVVFGGMALWGTLRRKRARAAAAAEAAAVAAAAAAAEPLPPIPHRKRRKKKVVTPDDADDDRTHAPGEPAVTGSGGPA